MTEFIGGLLNAVPTAISQLTAVLAALGPLDIVIVLLSLALAIRAAIRGFVAEAFGVAAIVAGVAVAAVLVIPASRYVDDAIGNESFWNRVIAFIVLFLGTYAALKLIEYILRRLSQGLRLQQLDHLFGLSLGFCEGVIISTVLIAGLHAQPWFDVSGLLNSSVVAGFVEQALGLDQAVDRVPSVR